MEKDPRQYKLPFHGDENLTRSEVTSWRKHVLKRFKVTALQTLGEDWTVLLESLSAPNYIIMGLATLPRDRLNELYANTLLTGMSALRQEFAESKDFKRTLPKKHKAPEKKQEFTGSKAEKKKTIEKAERVNGELSRALFQVMFTMNATSSVWKSRLDRANREINLVMQEVRDECNL